MTQHPKYAEMKLWSIEDIQAHLKTCPGTRNGQCIPGGNALQTAIHNKKHKQALHRIQQREKPVSGATRHKDLLVTTLGILLGTHDEFGKLKK